MLLFYMLRSIVLTFLCCAVLCTHAQTPKTYTSSEILLHLKKLDVLGSVLYIAAHPDDENTRLLAWLANEKNYRTGYLSLTRGDGGQNLIGNEQGTDLGLIRTQELLSARRIDGAEQFFSRAFDFGFCKNPEEALQTWGHDSILSDVVWVIRKFKPDVIITRFPEDGRAGHGHHSASAILAREAFVDAADSTKFPQQLKQGVTVWQAKRLLWNTYNFGGNNTQSEDQFKIDCGGFNALLGKSYGELAALSRSQHKSQGFGVPAQRGEAIEYFATIKGDKPGTGLLDGVVTDWSRVNEPVIDTAIKTVISNFAPDHPEYSVPMLTTIYKAIQNSSSDAYWKTQKLNELKELIKECSGLYMEAVTSVPAAVQGDSLNIAFTINNRLGVPVTNASIQFKDAHHLFEKIDSDVNASYSQTVFIQPNEPLTQPYWLVAPMDKGHFNVYDQQLIGKAENDPVNADFTLTINGVVLDYKIPVRYKYTDPIRGELYEPLVVEPGLFVQPVPPLLVVMDTGYALISKGSSAELPVLKYWATKNSSTPVNVFIDKYLLIEDTIPMSKGEERTFSCLPFTLDLQAIPDSKGHFIVPPGISIIDTLRLQNNTIVQYPVAINYDHIPSILYFKNSVRKMVYIDASIKGQQIGYIPGAGDKVPAALEQMGYKVTMLKQSDITTANLKQFDAIVTGVRAYNVDPWLNNVYDTLMEYVKNGGVMVAQYNTNNNFLSSINSKIGPYPFTVVNKRVTDEAATVNFLLPDDSILNYPNKITSADFEGWVQERSIYDVENIDSNYHCIISMHDPGEADQNGSLIVANYGKGRFVYTGLVFYRELPAGVPGAYRLFANLITK
jgi:LmbE family N-acetylglucosaminyl deacetylase